ncbi:GNAT family N-acetyltransferase [Streptomyces bacillaris]|uniref:GNAT family N-acetyltransferase n=1 Tax=Streptomyces bacillaris TaxID=68179 RepID=UPI00362D3B9F
MHSPSPLPLVDLPVRRLTRGALVSCADLSESRGWPRDEHRWGLLLSAGTGYGIADPEGKGLIAACVMTSYGPRLAAVGMLLVAERHARQGIARRLMRHVMAEAGPTPLALYSTSQGQRLYQELGFTQVGRTQRVLGRFRPEDRPSAVATRAAAADDLQAMVRLDLPVFGIDRTHIIARLPAFADRLQVAEENGELTGYAALWPSGDAHAVGPLVARDTATAKALVTAVAATTDRPLRVDVDARHEELLDWLVERGLERGSGTAVMTYGIADLPGDAGRRFAPLTVATG